MDVSSLEARPGYSLIGHLTETAILCEKWLGFAGEKLSLPLSEIGRLIGLLHDFGKASPEFQKKLHGEKFNSSLSQHAFLSAFLSYYQVKRNFNSAPWYIPFFSYIVVKRHHGYLHDIREEFAFDDYDRELLEKQMEIIGENTFDTLGQYLGLNLSYKDVKTRLQDFKKELREIKDKWDRFQYDLNLYVILNLFYSVLIDADRSEVVFHREIESYPDIIPSKLVDNYKSSQFLPSRKSVYKIREEAYKDAIERLREWNQSKKILSLTLPTGMGKTLIALKVALHLQEEIQRSLSMPIRIIYALPFLSIIDQNFDVFKKVLGDPSSDILLSHHHLVESNYKTSKDEYEASESWFLIEGWNSKIIVTTFVQLFETLFSGRASSLRKFHRLFPSIIILDEIQNFSSKYWILFREFAQFLSDKLDIWWMMVTATQPAIFDRTFELIPNFKKYFEKINRISVNFLPDKIDIQRLANLVHKSWKNERKKIMVEANTIGVARKLYETILNLGVNSQELEYLSSHIIPKERRRRIKKIKKRKTPFILITTQLVEAGVDIDFDEVWRDIAPWDSVVQASGRCNRNGREKQGIVKLYELYNSKNRRFANWVYDATLLDVSKELIEKELLHSLQEPDFVMLTPSYFKELTRRVSQDKGIYLLENIGKMRYSEISNFSLIEKQPNKMDVFVEYDKEANKIWESFLEIIEEKEIEKRKSKWFSIKNIFSSYLISVKKEWLVFLEDVGGIKYLPFKLLADFYEKKRGFIPQKDKTEIW